MEKKCSDCTTKILYKQCLLTQIEVYVNKTFAYFTFLYYLLSGHMLRHTHYLKNVTYQNYTHTYICTSHITFPKRLLPSVAHHLYHHIEGSRVVPIEVISTTFAKFVVVVDVSVKTDVD